MDVKLYTIHRRADRSALRVVGDIGYSAVIPPLWAILNGLWLSLSAMIVLLIAMAAIQPLALGMTYFALLIVTTLDGDWVMRAELRLLGWQEIGAVEARTAMGAEELFLRGETA